MSGDQARTPERAGDQGLHRTFTCADVMIAGMEAYWGTAEAAGRWARNQVSDLPPEYRDGMCMDTWWAL